MLLNSFTELLISVTIFSFLEILYSVFPSLFGHFYTLFILFSYLKLLYILNILICLIIHFIHIKHSYFILIDNFTI